MMPFNVRPLKTIFTRIGRMLSVFLLLIIFVIVVCNLWVVTSTEDRVFREISLLPYNDVALVLGTSNRTRGGRTNLHFSYRMAAAAQLFHTGKVRHLLLSGDNHIAWYNEPHNMRDSLVNRGVPESSMTLDYAGFRTFDSIIRAKKVFGRKKLTIVSQEYHNYRAVFIAKYLGIDAIAFTAREPAAEHTLMTQVREYFARVKVVLDLFILDTEPRFLGEPVNIIIDDTPDQDSTAGHREAKDTTAR